MQISYNNCAAMGGQSHIYFNMKFILILQADKYTQVTRNKLKNNINK